MEKTGGNGVELARPDLHLIQALRQLAAVKGGHELLFRDSWTESINNLCARPGFQDIPDLAFPCKPS